MTTQAETLWVTDKEDVRMIKRPTITENDSRASEHAKAKWWRLHIMGLRIDQLAELTGYRPRAIYYMELGTNSKGEKVKDWVWQRYKLVCAGVAANRKKEFNWN